MALHTHVCVRRPSTRTWNSFSDESFRAESGGGLEGRRGEKLARAFGPAIHGLQTEQLFPQSVPLQWERVL